MNEYDDVWKYFERSNDTAACNLCHKILGCKASTTTGLHRHLMSLHSMKRKVKEESFPSSSKKTKIMVKHTNCIMLEKIVSELAAKDGIPIPTICESEFIQNSVRLQGFVLPKEPSEVMKLIYRYHEVIKQEITSKIEKMKAKNKKFSLSMDERTSFLNRRYMTVQIHYADGDSDSLGLIRIDGPCPTIMAMELVDLKVKSFGLSFDMDIVSVMSNSDVIMLKFGKLSPTHQQLCYNEAIHLGVMDAHYEKIQEAGSDGDEDTSEPELKSEDEYVLENEREFAKENVRMNAIMKETVDKIRKIVKLFKNSPLQNTLLQSYVIAYEMQEMQLLLDSETRWNTIEVMIERFLRIKAPILSSLRDLNLAYLWIPEHDDAMAVSILKTLKTVRIAIEALSRPDANLLTGEGVLKFLFNTLKENNSDISVKLLSALKKQIDKRRDRSLISLMRFLQDPSCIHLAEEDEFFAISSKNDIAKTAITMTKRLFNNVSEQNDFEHFKQEQELDNGMSPADQDNNYGMNLEIKLEESIRQSLKPAKVIDDNFYSLSEEINLYETTGKITSNLEKLSLALSTIKPTSTQNERNFCISGQFVSNRRAHLSDKSMDCLCFLKYYLMKPVLK